MHPGNGSWGLDLAAMCLPPPRLALPVGAELSGRLHWGWGWGAGGGCNLFKTRLPQNRMVPDQMAGVLRREAKACCADTRHRGEKLCEDRDPRKLEEAVGSPLRAFSGAQPCDTSVWTLASRAGRE